MGILKSRRRQQVTEATSTAQGASLSALCQLMPEIWIQILEHLDCDLHYWEDRRNLPIILQTCQFLHKIALPLLYGNLKIIFGNTTLETLASFPSLGRLENDASLHGAVRSIVMTGPNFPSTSTPRGESTKWLEGPHRLYALLPKLTGLRRLHCFGVATDNVFYRTIISHCPPITTLSLVSEWNHWNFADFTQSNAGVLESPHPQLRTLSADTVVLIQPLVQHASLAENLRRLDVTVKHSAELSLWIYLICLCTNLEHLSFTGIEFSDTFPPDAMRQLRSFSGTPREASIIVPGRPVEKLNLTAMWVPPREWTDLTSSALRAACRSTAILQSLSMVLPSPDAGLLRFIQGSFAELHYLSVAYQAISGDTQPSSRDFLQTVVFHALESFLNLKEFSTSWNTKVAYAVWPEWDIWERDAVSEIGRRCPTLVAVRLQARKSWIYVDGNWVVDSLARKFGDAKPSRPYVPWPKPDLEKAISKTPISKTPSSRRFQFSCINNNPCL